MKFRDYFSLKHILFAIALFAIMMVFAVNQSNNTVKVYFEDTNVQITSAKYSMTIRYEDIASVELEELAEDGERLDQCYDDSTLRAGKWVNTTWGEYHITADLDVSTCIVVHVKDGRTLVFSRKNEETTAELYETLLTYLN